MGSPGLSATTEMRRPERNGSHAQGLLLRMAVLVIAANRSSTPEPPSERVIPDSPEVYLY